MTHQIDQLKDSIAKKDAEIAKESVEEQDHKKTNDKYRADGAKLQKQIAATEVVVKNQDSELAKLKFIISEAEAERQKQHKD
jgi:hypothetical protein